jgi:lysozyme
MEYSIQGLGLTEREEALRLTAYQDSGGIWTIGFGHTGQDVFPGQVITRQQAITWLQNDVQKAVNAVNASVRVSVTQQDFDSLVDFTYNVGVHAFETSTLLKKLNAGDYAGANAAFKSWVFVKGQVNKGLWNRRQAEQDEFTSGGTPNG